MGAVLFFGVVLLVVALIHLYLWKRLVRDTTRRGRWRVAGTVAIVALALLLVGTMVGSRLGLRLAAWPGYLWLAVMFYLLVVLVVLEVPMFVAKRVVARRAPAGEVAVARRGGMAGGARGGTATEAVDDGTLRRPATPADVGADVATDAAKGGAAGGQRPAGDTDDAGPADGARPPSGDPHRGGPARGARPPTGDPHRGGPARGARPPSGDPGRDGRSRGEHGSRIGDEAPNPDRRLLLSRTAAIVAGVTAVGLTGSGVRSALSAPQVNRIRIDLAKLPRSMDGLRIATVSDIHLGPLAGRAHAERVVSVINSVEADLVAVVGDLVDGTVAELGEAAEPLQDIRSRLGAFFVTGNHEYYSGAEEWVAEVERLGLRALRNERVEIDGLDLAGVNDLADEANAPDFDKTLAGRDPNRPVVLLAHQPVLVDRAREHGVDLQLSGHTHGGQIMPFNLIVRLAQPVVSGYARFDDTQLFVTNGAGFWGPPVRVGAPPQVTLVQLHAQR